MMRVSAGCTRAGNIRLAGLLLGLSPLFFGVAGAAEVTPAMPTKAPAVMPTKAPANSRPKRPSSCAGIFFADEDPNDTTANLGGYRFDLAGACARVTGSVTNTFQNNLSVKITDGSNNSPPSTNTLTSSASLDTSRATSLGALTTSTMVQWQKATNDGTQNGIATVQSLYGSLGGVTGGYTSSLMDFWSGDFLFFASTPNASVGIASYERAITDNVKFAIAAESGLPSSSQAARGIQGLDTTSPDATARFRYTNDADLTLHLSGLVRQADFPATMASPEFHKTGWAASFGASMPLPITGKEDTASMQFDYAVNAVQTLGTVADIKQNEANGLGGPTRGWSVVASMNHPWTDKLESNAFVSYIAVDEDVAGANPSARSTRLAANIFWRPYPRIRFGTEIGWVHAVINADGLQGLPFSKLDGVTGFLSARLEF